MDVALVLQIATIGSLLTPLVLATGRWVVGRRAKTVNEAQVVQKMAMELAAGMESRIASLTRELTESDREIDALDQENHFLRALLKLHNIPLPRASVENRHREDTSKVEAV